MATTSHRPADEGSSLIELLAATIITVVAIGAILSMVVQQTKLRRLDLEINQAHVACRDKIEQLRSVPVDQLLALHGTGFAVAGPNGEAGGLQTVPGDPDGLPGSYSVIVDKTASGRTLYRVLVRVAWTGVLGRQQSSLEVFIGERKGT